MSGKNNNHEHILKSGETQAESATLLLAFLPSFGWLVPVFSLYNGASFEGTYLDLFPDEEIIWLVVLFFFFHHLRMALGFAFISQDDSFKSALKEAYDESEIKSLSKSEVVIRFTMTLLLGSTLVLFKYQVIPLLHVVLFFQIFIMATYNRVFWWALYDKDVEKWKNASILVGDLCFVILFLCGLGCSLGLWVDNPKELNHIIMIVFSIFCLLFFFEILFQYKEPLKKQLLELLNGYKILYNRIYSPSPLVERQTQHNNANQADAGEA